MGLKPVYGQIMKILKNITIIKTFKKRLYIKKSKFSSRATKHYENKSDLHEISRRIDWEYPRGAKIG